MKGNATTSISHLRTWTVWKLNTPATVLHAILNGFALSAILTLPYFQDGLNLVFFTGFMRLQYCFVLKSSGFSLFFFIFSSVSLTYKTYKVWLLTFFFFFLGQTLLSFLLVSVKPKSFRMEDWIGEKLEMSEATIVQNAQIIN